VLGEAALGVLITERREDPHGFTPAQIALVETFAAQAVIAIQNTRLFEELQTRNREQAEALEREQATAEVLRIISRAPTDLDLVLAAIIENACRLCAADGAFLWQSDDDGLRRGAGFGMGPEADAFFGAITLVPEQSPHTLMSRTALGRQVVHDIDTLADPVVGKLPGATRFGIRTQLGVPMLRDDELIGVLTLNRKHQEAFTPEQIALVLQ